MRYIFRNQEGDDLFFNLNKVTEINSVWKYEFSFCDKEEIYFVRKLAGKTYLSIDKLNWKKISCVKTRTDVVLVNQIFKVYRGFKPSGLVAVNPGSLVTQMPGKVVKLMVKEGEEVKLGQTLLILEAMKMENEIKAGMDGVVETICVQEGQALESGSLMIELA
jgi:biotin carboxyl carrier protein